MESNFHSSFFLKCVTKHILSPINYGNKKHILKGIKKMKYDIVKSWKMPNHEYAQCKVLESEDGTLLLKSYNTIVVSISKDGWMDCSGIYSRTTIKHIGWFMRLYGHGCTYFDAKWAWMHDSCVNVLTGEVLTYEEYNKKSEEIA